MVWRCYAKKYLAFFLFTHCIWCRKSCTAWCKLRWNTFGKMMMMMMIIWQFIFSTSSTCTECGRPSRARAWLEVTHHYSAPEATLAAGQVSCHLQNCYYHASDFPPSMPVVPLWPYRVCFGWLECTPTSLLHYSGRCRQTKQDAVRKACPLSGRPRHMEQSPRHHPYHRLLPSLPLCAQDTSFCSA